MRRPKAARRGMALLVVMVIVILVSLAAYGFNQQMTDAYRVSQMQIERAQARLTAMSAIDALRVAIERPRGDRMGWHLGETEAFAAVAIEEDQVSLGDSEESGWSFSVLTLGQAASQSAVSSDQPVSLSGEQQKTWRFGLSNESAKLNLLVLGQWEDAVPGQAKKALMNLPGMDAGLADAMMRAYNISDTSNAGDYRLSDRIGAFATTSTQRSGNSHSADDQSASGWARDWAFGYSGGDWDENYRLDSLELALLDESTSPSDFNNTGSLSGGSSLSESSSGDPLLSQTSSSESSMSDSSSIAPVAWRDFVTFNSGQRNVTLSGTPRIFLNGKDLQKLHQDLSAIWSVEQANFVIAYRQFGGSKNGSNGKTASSVSLSEWSPDFSKPAKTQIESSLDLIDATVDIPESDDKVLRLHSPFSDDFGDRSDYARALIDDVTVDHDRVIDGQVDVNEAPQEVLLGVPGMTPAVADQIIERRASAIGAEATRDTIAWLWVENVIDLPTLKQLQPWITVGGDCYHTQIVAYRDNQTPLFRCTVTLDGTSDDVLIRNFRQWDAWGNGFLIEQLRSETAP